MLHTLLTLFILAVESGVSHKYLSPSLAIFIMFESQKSV